MDIRISTEEHGLTLVSVSLDGRKAGYASFETGYRAPKKWSARRNNAVEIGRFSSSTAAVFAIALDAHDRRTAESIKAKLAGAR